MREGIDKTFKIATFCYMSTVIRISSDLAQEAKTRSSVEKRSMTSQVEYWARIGKVAEDNPELPFSFIKEILIAQEEAKCVREVPEVGIGCDDDYGVCVFGGLRGFGLTG